MPLNTEKLKNVDPGSIRRVIVVGNGASGLATALELARRNVPVLLLSETAARRAPSVSDPDGINAALGPDDSSEQHLEDSLVAAAGLAERAALARMVQAAPALVRALCALQVPLQRDGGGHVELRRSPGSSFERTACAGSSTGQQVLYGLDDELRRQGNLPVLDRFGAATAAALVERCEGFSFLSLVLDDDQRAVGVVAREMRTGLVRPFRGEAVCLATGGYAGLYDGSSASPLATGSALGRAFRQGAVLANPELVQFRPLSVLLPGTRELGGKCLPLAESLRSFGARAWSTNSDGLAEAVVERQRNYFLEALPGDARPGVGTARAAQAVYRACQQGRAFLDVSHLDSDQLERRFGAAFSTLQRLGLPDPANIPLGVEASADLSLGGLWVDLQLAGSEANPDSPHNHQSSIPGLFAVGECTHRYAGAGVLPGNALLSCLFGGRTAAASIAQYTRSLARSSWDLPGSLFEKSEARERDRVVQIGKRTKGPNPFALRREIGQRLRAGAFVERSATQLEQLVSELDELGERCAVVSIHDPSSYHNGSLALASTLEDLVLLAQVVARGALARSESRGHHQRTDAPAEGKRQLTLARFDGGIRLLDSFVSPTREAEVTRAVESGGSSDQ
jgi:succinate dehydrogenase / fumarate reductase flavoprotein subunit